MNERSENEAETQTPQLDTINQSILTQLVQRVLNSDSLVVCNWEYKQLHGGAGVGNAIYRFAVKGMTRDRRFPGH